MAWKESTPYMPRLLIVNDAAQNIVGTQPPCLRTIHKAKSLRRNFLGREPVGIMNNQER